MARNTSEYDVQLLRILVTDRGAILGELDVRGTTFPCIENRAAGGTARPFLRPGAYQLRMWTKASDGVRCLQVYEAGLLNFMIHPTRGWRRLRGCIAPGKSTNGRNVFNSPQAMAEIFGLLGGYNKGDRFSLFVHNNPPGDPFYGRLDQTKEQWLRK